MPVSHLEPQCNRTLPNFSDATNLECVASNMREQSSKVPHQYTAELIRFCSIFRMSGRNLVITFSSSFTSGTCSGAFLQ